MAADENCHSEEEEVTDPDGRVAIYRLDIEERHRQTTHFFRDISDSIKKECLQKHDTRSKKSDSVIDPPADFQQNRRIYTLPTSVPIDYFDPEEFNAMSVGQWAKYMGNSGCPSISGPAEDGWWKHRDRSGPHEAKTMGFEEFMDKYSDSVLAQYHLPTEAELAAIERWAENDSLSEGETIDTSEATQGTFRREGFKTISTQADFANQMAVQTGSGSGAGPSGSGSSAGPSGAGPSGSGGGAGPSGSGSGAGPSASTASGSA